MSESVTSDSFALADAVALFLASYSATVIAAPTEELARVRTRTVVVMPVTRKRKLISRVAADDDFVLHVGVFNRFSTDADGRSLMADVETIGKSLIGSTIGGCVCTEATWDPLYDFAAYRNHVFESVIEAVFKKMTARQ